MSNQNSLTDSLARLKNTISNQAIYSKPIIPTTNNAYGLKSSSADRIKQMAEEEAKKEFLALKKGEISTSISKAILPNPFGNEKNDVFNILKYLKETRKARTITELGNDLNKDFSDDFNLVQYLKQNSKILFKEDTKTFEFKPDYNIESTQDLLSAVSERYKRNIHSLDPEAPVGFEVKELEESKTDPDPFIKELISSKKLFAMRNKDGAPRALYLNTYNEDCTFDQEFKEMWSDIKAPGDSDLMADMVKANLKVMDTFEKKLLVENKPQAKKARQSNRKVKITNTHLA